VEKTIDVIFAAVVLLVIVATSAILAIELLNFMRTDTEVIATYQRVNAVAPLTIELPRLNKFDRVYLILNATTPIYNITVQPRGVLLPLPLDVEGFEIDAVHPIMLTKHYFFVANTSGQAKLVIYPQPKTPYAIKDFEGKTSFTVFSYVENEEEYMGISIKVLKFRENRFAQVILVIPFDELIQPDFQVQGVVKVLEGKVAYVNLIIVTDIDWYAINVISDATQPTTISFNVNAGSPELFDRTGKYLGQRGVYLALGVGLYEGHFTANESPQATIAIGNITIINGGKIMTVPSKVLYEYDLYYRLYIFRKFQPTHEHVVLVSSLILEVVVFNYIVIKLWKTRVRR